MPKTRSIRKALKGKATTEGAGVHLSRGFGFHEVPLFDPFLLFDDFRSNHPDDYVKGFPWHPHRGIETITYVLSGDVEHGDSLGNEGVIGSGDVQWMTAGSGIIHQEMPKGDASGRMEGFQLWANLPARQKMTDPRYRGLTADRIPDVTLDAGVRARIIAGELAGTRGPVDGVAIEPTYLDLTVPPHTEYRHPTPPGHTVFAYVMEGAARFCLEEDPFTYDQVGDGYFDYERALDFGNRSVVLFDDGDEIVVLTGEAGVRFLLVSGRPIGEPIAWYGPIVMNTSAELRCAFEEFRTGTFIKHDAS